MNDILRKITLNPISLAILIGMAIILLLPDIFDKYKYEKEVYDTNKFMFEKTYYVADLDSDSIDEFILSFAYENKHSIQVLTHDKGIVDQWNTHMNLPYGKKRLCIGDYDKDGFKEFYAFSDNNDTIFLFCYEPLDTIHPMWINNHPLLELTREFNEPDYMFNHIELRDINMDGHPDLFFVINSGKARFPRNLCYYDIKNDTLIRSEDIGNTFNQGATIEDINGDGKPEIYGNVCASGQVHDSLGYDYSDYSSWIFVYNNDLELVFDPLEFKNFRNFVNVEHIVIDQQDYLLAFYNHRGMNDNYPKLLILNTSGEILSSVEMEKSNKDERWIKLDNKKDTKKIFIIDESGLIRTFNTELIEISTINLGYNIRFGYNEFDLNGNGLSEKVFILEDNNLLITQQNFKYPLLIPFESQITTIMECRYNNDKSLFVVTKEKGYILYYSKNPLFIFKYLIYAGIILVLYLFIALIRKLQLIQIEKKEKIRNKIYELQLKSFKNQMDPHFTFNVFNTIAYKIQKESPESYEAFMEFSNLIRKTLISTDSITRSISDEISKLESYLKLEQMRYGESISYQITIEDNIDKSFHIPKLLLQTYVENAIKHGLRPKETNGKLSVNIYKKQKNVIIEIEDNGIGRKKSRELKTKGTGFGMKIMDDYITLFNESNRHKIKQEIIDIEENNRTGTKIIISIPIEFRFSFKSVNHRAFNTSSESSRQKK